MPRPVRAETALGSGQPILKAERYAIEHIGLDDVALLGTSGVIFKVGEVTLRNFNLHAEILGYTHRRAVLESLWSNSAKLPADIAQLLDRHRALVRGPDAIPVAAEQIVSEIQSQLTDTAADYGIVYRQGTEDAVPDLERTLSLAGALPPPDIEVGQVAPEETELRRRTAREWKRWANARGAASAKFRRDVREAYEWTCIVCGLHFPQTPFNRIAGVDAAHILPWATYDLDEVANGLCLCRQHHWAFDEGLLVIRPVGGGYVIEIPPTTLSDILGHAPKFALDSLKGVAGPIPMSRLPRNRAQWPKAEWLEILNESQGF